MPISRDAAKVSIDFTYDTSPDDKENNIEVALRYHNTEEYGETISILNSSLGLISFPAKLFAEATDYLRLEYGKLVNKSSPGVSQTQKKNMFPIGGTNKLVPTQINKAGGFVQSKPQQSRPKPQNVEDEGAEDVGNFEIDHTAIDIQSLSNLMSGKKKTPHARTRGPGVPPVDLDNAIAPESDPEFSLDAAKTKKMTAPPPRKTFTPKGRVRNRDLD